MTANYTPVHNIGEQITILNNYFIDNILPKADGEYIKIYLMLLRLQSAGEPVSVDILADRLELTQKDVVRALSYWVREGVLQKESIPGAASPQDLSAVEDFPGRERSGSSGQKENRRQETPPYVCAPAQPRPIPAKTSPSPELLAGCQEDSDLSRTVYMAEIYLGKPLSMTDLESLFYIHDQLCFTPDLMDYLIEYCVDRGKKSIRYIEKVAIGWFTKGITTVEEARAESRSFTDNVFPVMKAFGLSGRNPGPSELDFIENWNRMGLGTSLIIEACSRTLLAINQPSFRYANRILEEWKKQGVRTIEDVKNLDRQHLSAVRTRKEEQAAASPGSRIAAAGNSANSFHNFNQRQYNYNSLESALTKANRRP